MTSSQLSMNDTFLKDALHNAHPDNTKTMSCREYARGVLVGIVAGLMASGMYFDDAWKMCLEETINPKCIPNGWPTKEDYAEVDRLEAIRVAEAAKMNEADATAERIN